jgi:predicted PurR-regulated permease PerM
MRDVLQTVTAIMVAIIGAGGIVFAAVITRRTRDTRDTANDIQSKVNGRLDQLLESNKRLTDQLIDYLTRDLGGGDNAT